MTNMKKVLALSIASFCISAPAWAGSHTWRFSEVFSNASGTIQFIEFKCDISGENFVGTLHISTTGLDQNGNPIPDFVFPANLGGSTANKKLLLGTSAFDNLFSLQPGAPHVDYIDSQQVCAHQRRYPLVQSDQQLRQVGVWRWCDSHRWH